MLAIGAPDQGVGAGEMAPDKTKEAQVCASLVYGIVAKTVLR
jgi:hypothetical protein